TAGRPSGHASRAIERMDARRQHHRRRHHYQTGGSPMNHASTTIRTLRAALNLPRLLAVLTLAIALIAIPAVSPDDAGAMRMSERTLSRLCSNAGGSLYYDFMDDQLSFVYNVTCTLPSGAE